MNARLWNTLRHEPLAHFLVLAGLLFLANALFGRAGPEPIVVAPSTIDFLVQQQTELAGRPLTEAERQAAIEGFVDDEVLVREAYRRGLDQDDVVRRHLVQKMQFVLGDEVPAPTEQDLKAFLEANPERYRDPPTVSLDHVFYADPAQVPDDLLTQLQGGAAIERLGDRLYTLDRHLSHYSLSELIGLIGPEAARQVFDLPSGEWHGPLTSDEGVHFVRVVERHPPVTPPFDQLETQLRQDWTYVRQGEAVAARLRELREHYRIVIGASEP